MNGWRETTIGDVLTLQRGFDITKKEQQFGDVPVVSSGGISSYHNVSSARGPGVVIGRKGTLGKVFYLQDDYWPHDTTLWVKDFKGNWPRFVYYFMTQIDTSWLDGGSANPTLNRNHLHPLKVRWPNVTMQKAIAEVLGTLDDKIAANTKLINTTDTLSRALFKSMLNESDAEDVPLSETADFVNGKAFTKGASGTGRVVVRIAELNSGLGDSTVYSDIEVAEQHIARPGDLLFAWSGSLTLHRWFRPEAIINQHIFKVIPNAGYPVWLVYELIRHKLEEFKAIAAGKATTMGHIQRQHLQEPVTVPAPFSIKNNKEFMAGLWKRGLAAQKEILHLEAMRDILLPHLMSGKLSAQNVLGLSEAFRNGRGPQAMHVEVDTIKAGDLSG